MANNSTLNLSSVAAAANGYHNDTTASSHSTLSNYCRAGEFVYIETSPGSPYQIGKIDDFVKTSNNVEVKLQCYYRRRDVPSHVKPCELDDDSREQCEKEIESLSENVRHQVRLREVYVSCRAQDTQLYPASSIRGKCTVNLLCEAEPAVEYLKKDDAFYYLRSYDPNKAEICQRDSAKVKVGQMYQAEVPSKRLEDPEKEDKRVLSDLEVLVYQPNNNLTVNQLEQYLTVSTSLATYARALDSSTAAAQPGLHQATGLACRDAVLQHAMDTLHQSNYDICKAIFNLVPGNQPKLIRDEMERWSSCEASIFEEALEKIGKNFHEIRQTYLPWKKHTDLIEYYYMWKATDRYVQQKRIKAVGNETRVKQFYISNKKQINGANVDSSLFHQCESCRKTSSSNWNQWGPVQGQFFLCNSCWNYWKKFGGFKYPNKLTEMSPEKLLAVALANQANNVRTGVDLNSQYPCRECNKVFNRQERLMSHMAASHRFKCSVAACGKEFKQKSQMQRHFATSHGAPIRSGSPRPIMKSRSAFYFHAIPALRTARRVCADVLNLKHSARYPFIAINLSTFKQEYLSRFEKGITQLPKLKNKNRGQVVDISHRLGTPYMAKPEWLIALPKDQLPKPERLAFPPTRNEDKDTLDGKSFAGDLSRKRPLDQNGNSLPSKRRQMAPPSILGKSVPDLYQNISRSAVSTSSNGRAKVATFTSDSGQKQMISWVDAPDDVYFVANDKIKQMRRKIVLSELRRAARRPWKRCARGVSLSAGTTAQTAATANSSTSAVSASHSSNSNSVNVPQAVAALNLATQFGQLPSNSQVAAFLQHQIMAQNLPILSGNHLPSASSFLAMPPSNATGGGAGKLTR